MDKQIKSPGQKNHILKSSEIASHGMALFPSGLKAYICGPVTGIEEGNEPLFREFERVLIKLGYSVVVPHDLDPKIDYDLQLVLSKSEWKEYVWRKYMRVCIPEVSSSHLIVTLPNWSESRGCKTEVQLARDLFIPIVHCVNVKPSFEFEETIENVNKVL